VAAAALAVGVGGPSPATAPTPGAHHHLSEPAPGWSSPSPEHPGWRDPLLLVPAGLALAGMAAIRRPSARAIRLTLAVLVGSFALEAAVHSVHHFGDPEGAEACTAYASSQRVTGDVAHETDASTPPTPQWRSPTESAPEIAPPRFTRPDEGRAPPAAPQL
jgi:hypothetical protein